MGGQPVTVTIAREVAPGHEDDFAEWSARLTAAASRSAGYLGAGLLRPGRLGDPWHVVFRFDSGEHLRERGAAAAALALRTHPASLRRTLCRTT